MFRRVKKRYPGPQEKKMTVGPGFLQKTGLAEDIVSMFRGKRGKNLLWTRFT